ncbi:MAG: orotate phosphoribosyltransferase, partial [Methanogenium sp.]|nr:orotate phosphoribosyltransferase [Methanogenium sp.]
MVNKVADLLIEYGAIEFGDFTLASGSKSSYYIDIKSASTNPFLLESIGRIIAERYDFDVVAGVAVGAVPIAVAVSLSAGKPYAIIRK